ncbi:MAG: GNAT family N-acetyltransferase [Rhizobiaceae bacterium]
MSIQSIAIRGELPEDAACLDSLALTVFGPGMRARAAYFLREGVEHELDLSFVVEKEGKPVGTVRLTKVFWGDQTVLMLGPLAVLPEYKGRGAGKLLMQKAVEEAREKAVQGGCPAILLVGDLAYYQPFGFQRIPPANISLPRPADPMRVLACELVAGSLGSLSGSVTRFNA